MKNTIKIYLMALWFTAALVLLGSGTGEFSWTNGIGLALFVAFALFTRIADKKGWVKLNETNEA
ncbi:MAG: hypothetical protein KBS67_05335 [Bacteroidales bacterium]|nr:hypothetical protein [Candidatus Cryptobacteroides equifaecalis]